MKTNVPAMYSARSGYEIVNEIGVTAIRAESQRQTRRLIALADEAGFTVHSPATPQPGVAPSSLTLLTVAKSLRNFAAVRSRSTFAPALASASRPTLHLG